jgi:hypothetical protein
LDVAKRAHAKVADEKKTIAEIKAGRYSSAWVDAQIQHKGD